MNIYILLFLIQLLIVKKFFILFSNKIQGNMYTNFSLHFIDSRNINIILKFNHLFIGENSRIIPN